MSISLSSARRGAESAASTASAISPLWRIFSRCGGAGLLSKNAVSVDPDFGSPEKLERNTMQIGQTNENEMDRQTCTGYERGSSTVARMVMKILCSISVLVSVLSPGAMEGQVAVPKILNNGDFSVSFTGTPEQNYVVESSDSLIPPMTWTSLRTRYAPRWPIWMAG